MIERLMTPKLVMRFCFFGKHTLRLFSIVPEQSGCQVENRVWWTDEQMAA